MNEAQRRLREELGLESTSRIKTDTTIVEKLVRERTRLSKMQDIAGIRTWGDYSLREQTQVCESISALFPGAKVVDLRELPHFGYRAVHLVVQVDGFPTEIQVRTRRQQLWAETMEKFADRFGRGLRYGQALTFTDDNGLPLPEDEDPLGVLMRISVNIAEVENDLQQLEQWQADARRDRDRVAGLPSEPAAKARELLAKRDAIMADLETTLADVGVRLDAALHRLAGLTDAVDSDEK